MLVGNLNKSFIFAIIIVIIGLSYSYPQRITDKNKGDHNQTKKGIMDGNLVSTVFYNFGEIADWENEPSRSGVWPKGTNHTYVDGIAVMVQAEAVDPSGNKIHPLESNYYEFTRYDPVTRVTYGWWPLPGYANPYQSSIARSDDQSTWPNSWPDRTSDWNQQWNGFFGKGMLNADLETFFVFDDNEDREYLKKNNFYPDADDHTRGGLGMQVRGRGFQWSQVLAEDVIFWYYEITNMGTTDYPKTLFGQYVDWGIGGHDNSSNNAGDYDEVLDISYAWSTVYFGSPGNWTPVGLAAYAFLESPGISDDRIDNDQDGLTDERRDNVATRYITDVNQDPFVKNPQTDTLTFKSFYGNSWKEHWDADENCNWRTYTDLNKNGKWDSGEPLNDDVGSDGLGPYDEGYPGPDLDGSEGDGKPEQGEPSFGILDKDETDQLGLTGFAIFPTHRYELLKDEENWGVLSSLPSPHGSSLVGVNLANFFSSYLFRMNGRNTYSSTTGTRQETGETQRFSMALIFGIDKDDLFRRKKTTQSIYNANYRFAKPPEKPVVNAIPGDGRVTLYWDDRAENTFDAFYQKYNFEGYRVYRSTEPNFIENKLITDAYGKATFRKPLAMFDVVDGVKGLHPINVNGALFDLGTDSGIKHSFIDTTVQNGQTYYYAVCAYDQGFVTSNVKGTIEGIPPSETTSILKVDINGKIKKDINTAVVTPRAPAAGYVAPQLESFKFSGNATGSVGFNILDPDSVKKFHTYRLEFEDNTPYHNNPYPSYRLIDFTSKDTLLKQTKFKGSEVQTPVLHGFALTVKNDSAVVIDKDKTGWKKGNSNYIVKTGFDPNYSSYSGQRVDYPADFEILFTTKGQGDTSYPASSFSQPVFTNISITNVTENIPKFQFLIKDNDNDGMFTAGDAIFLVFGDSAGSRATGFSDQHFSWSVTLEKDTAIAPANQRAPQPGDIFRIVTKKPFRTGDYTEFITKGVDYDRSKASTDLDRISVVPNPYIGAASWEAATTGVGRGERKIYFIHLPKECTIRIYTLSGNLVQTITHNTVISDGQEPWNLVSKDGMDIAFGVYIFNVEAPGIGSKTGKFAIIK